MSYHCVLMRHGFLHVSIINIIQRGETMPYFCTFGDVQSELRNHYRRTGDKIQFIEAIDALYKKGKLMTSRPDLNVSPVINDKTDSEEFEKIVDKIVIRATPSIALSERVSEEEMFPQLGDVFVIRHPRYTRLYLHRHDYVEIDYVISGSCRFHFEDEIHELHKGNLCIILPGSYHDIEVSDESIVYCIMLRRSTFQSSFFSLLSRDDTLSLFFRAMMTEPGVSNYMLFDADNPELIRILVQSVMQECHFRDIYSNSCCVSLVHLIFAYMLRSENSAPKVYNYQMGSDFSAIIHYIRDNYQHISLSSLAEQFHYSKPHMCTLIKQNTGTSFSNLIKQVRISRAKEYLIKTDTQISDIAEAVGYNSADHFSRVFRSSTGLSPQEFRRSNKLEHDSLVPFKTE